MRNFVTFRFFEQIFRFLLFFCQFSSAVGTFDAGHYIPSYSTGLQQLKTFNSSNFTFLIFIVYFVKHEYIIMLINHCTNKI